MIEKKSIVVPLLIIEYHGINNMPQEFGLACIYIITYHQDWSNIHDRIEVMFTSI